MAAPMKNLCKNVSAQAFGISRSFCTSFRAKNGVAAAAAVQDERRPYRLYGGLILERRPVVTAELNEMEQKYHQLQSTVELELSQLSHHELRLREDQKIAKLRLQENFDESKIAAGSLTAQDMEDSWVAENAAFTPADRVTDADRSACRLTSHRKLDKSLYLLVKQKFHIEPEGRWVFPQAVVQAEESLLQTCERVLADLSPVSDVRFSGHAPCALHKISYPKRYTSEPSSFIGAKIFFMKCQLLSGDVTSLSGTIQEKISDFCWVTEEEARGLLGRPYRNSVKAVLHER